MTRLKAFTLIELLIGIAIISIIVSFTLPNFSTFTIKVRVNNQISELQRLLLITRNHAINKSAATTMCPLNTSNECENSWKNAISVFVDMNNNGFYEPNNNEELIVVKEAINNSDTLLFSYDRVSYQPTGTLNGIFNGTMKYCPNGHDELSRGIIISSTTGRIYTSQDTNNDGRDNNRSGKNISCL